MTSASSPAGPTRSLSCTPAGSWNVPRHPPCSRKCACPIPRRCWRRSRKSMPPRTRPCRRFRGGRRIRPGHPGLLVFAALPLCHRTMSSGQTLAYPSRNARPSVCLLPPDQSRSRRERMMHDTRPQPPLRDPLLTVENLVVEYAVGGKTVHAVSDVSLQVARGETLGLVGESGCGKSTLGRAVLQLRRAVSGRVLFDGQDLTAMQGDALRRMRRRVQLIFQDPIASLNPRRRIGDIVAEPLVIAGVKDPKQREQLVFDVLTAVGLDPDLVTGRLPHEFSGGQCQRICIARALVLNPEFIICDEPVSALDVSIRAQILNLLEDMKARFGLTLLFIAHDLAVVKAVSDRVAVMYLGRLCEVGPSEQLFAQPAHPYTALLIEAIPVPDPDVRPAESVAVGEPPSPIAPPSGCRFRTRCPRADQRCIDEVPELRSVAPGQFAACHHPLIGPG